MEISSQDITEILNVLMNDRSSLVSYTLDFMSPPKLISLITPLSPLNKKRFLRDLRSGKVKQICVLIAEYEYASDIQSAMVFAENERFLSSSSMDASALDEKTRIERYTPKSWESIKANSIYDDLMEYRDVFPESVPCYLSYLRQRYSSRKRRETGFEVPCHEAVDTSSWTSTSDRQMLWRSLSSRPCEGVHLST